MKRKIELLAPGGDIESIKAAIAAGADAVYFGLNTFNARYRATNIELDDLTGIVSLAHANRCEVFITINIIIIESEIKTLINLLNKLVNKRIDGVIVQDLGLFYLLSHYFKNLKIHASTQLTTHNAGQIKFLSKLTTTRVNLSRELNLNEIKSLAKIGDDNDIATEVFVHGSNCLSFSGLCYISSVLDGKSGNRGRCSQPCRDQYLPTPEGKEFPLNLKDNSAFNDLDELYVAGVDAVKIEGRMKKFHYVYTVVKAWRNQLDQFYADDKSRNDDISLYQVFNRDFTNGFLQEKIDKEMYIDNPRDNSARYFSEIKGRATAEGLQQTKKELYDLRTGIMENARLKIGALTVAKTPINISAAGKTGGLLNLLITAAAPSSSFAPFKVHSSIRLVPIKDKQGEKGQNKGLDHATLYQGLKELNETDYQLAELKSEQLQKQLFLPHKELIVLKKQIVFVLNGSIAEIPPVELPRLKQPATVASKPTLSVVISSREELQQCQSTSAELFFQLPNCFEDDSLQWIELFRENSRFIPWFPAVLIGDDYTAAVDILQRLQPKRIVTDNTGIAYEAYKRGIDWVAGPSLNSVNSFTLLCLKKKFNCTGAFISNELSRDQIKKIVTPERFNLYYSIYHPILLMTSRSCLFHQVEGCNKSSVDKECSLHCSRAASITTLKNETLIINKSKGCYHRIYNQHNFLNSDIVSDLPGLFSSFCIDLTNIPTETKSALDNSSLIQTFEQLLKGSTEARQELEKNIRPTTHRQYNKGI